MSKKVYNNVELLSSPKDDNHIAKLENIKIDTIKVNGVEQVPKNKIVNIITSNAQFKSYSELLQSTNEGKISISEGMIVFVNEGEIIETTATDGTVTKTEYPSGLYKWNSKSSKWEHQDYLVREEFANHVEDSAKHVTAANRFSWDNKADGTFETADIDITSSLLKGQSKYIVDSAYLYTQLKNMKTVLDADYESKSDLKDHEDNKHTDVLHLTSEEKKKLHTHDNKSEILDKLGKDTNGNLTFDGTSVVGGKAVATKTLLGQVIVGKGIDVESNGTIYIDWYNSTDNGDGTSDVTIGSLGYTKDEATGEIIGTDISGVPIGVTKETDSTGKTVTVQKIGDTNITVTEDTDGSKTIVTDDGSGVPSVTKKDPSGNVISSVIGGVVIDGVVREVEETTTTDSDGNTVKKTVTTEKTPDGETKTEVTSVTKTDGDGNRIDTIETITTTPDGQTKNTNTVTTKPTGEVTETDTTLNSNGKDTDVGIATGQSTTVEKDSTGNITDTTTEEIITRDGEDCLIKQEDLNDLFASIDTLW